MDERYKRAKKLFLAVCDLDPAERKAVLDKECADDAELRADVESLLAHHDAPTAEISGAGPDVARREEIDQPMRIGPYRVIRELGRGGMGVVYLGMREDDQFKRRVAIKVLKRGMDSEEILGRFELERQLLAALNHPGIARLYDGGQTDDGLPYFAMEYVEGQPIDDYCDTHRLRIAERLELFRTACSAVHYAHQNTVIHRDLKPGNIIVTKDGVPKLLDFGIAKLVNPELSLISGDPTAPGLKLMTPEYASPEQVRGDPISTASDIYSLGVLLYELVTGHRPYRLRSRVQEEVERVICNVDPERPSTAISKVEEIEPDEGTAPDATTTITPETVSRVREGRPERLRRRLAGDIDNIVLMAMRKEPQRRYTSAEQFAEDLRRHLNGLPVIARRDTVGYRSLKFVRRHRVGVAAVSVIFLLLLAGILTTTWQARVAKAERDRAEARFKEVRELANIFMHDFHDRIKRLDGSLPARELLVTTALKYLDGLAREVGDDVDLRRDLASGYDRVGEIRGGIRGASRGDTSGALENFRTALAIREALLNDAPDDLELRRLVSVSHMKVGDGLQSTGNTGGALKAYSRALDISEALARADGRYRRGLALDLLNAGAVAYWSGDLEQAREQYSRSLKIRRELAESDRDNPDRVRDVSVGLCRVAEIQNAVGDVDGALERYQEAIRLRQENADAAPHSGRFRRDLGLAHYFAATAMLSLGRTEEAKPHIDHFFTVAQQRAADNPNSIRAQDDLALAHLILGEWKAGMDDLEGALESYRACQSIIVPLSAAEPSIDFYRGVVAKSHELMAEVLERLGRLTAAMPAYQRALEIVTELSDQDPIEARLRVERARILSALGGLLLETGELGGARQRLEEASVLLEELRELWPTHAETRHELALALYRLSQVMDRSGEPDAAAELAEQSWALLEESPPGPKATEMRRLLEQHPDGGPDSPD
ncbi:MAG: protein kinase domain-containing protein [Planctomycetota bacterium]|jgi:serine/threonine protein kinase